MSAYDAVLIKEDDEDAVLIKWSPSGTLFWNRSWGGAGQDSFSGVWGDGAGNIFTCGETTSFGALNFAAILVKWYANGTKAWNMTYDTSTMDTATSLWGDSLGNIFTYGTKSIVIGTNYDGLLIKWNMTGNVLWTRRWGNSGEDYGYDLWIDENDSIYTASSSESAMGMAWQAVITKWTWTESALWNVSWGNSGIDEPYSILGDNNGNLFMTGYTENASSNLDNMFLAKYASNGTKLWDTTWGSTGWDYGATLCIAGGTLYVAGKTETLGTNPNDIFLHEYSIASMARTAGQTWGTIGTDQIPTGRSIAVAAGGFLYFVATVPVPANGNDLALVRFKPAPGTTQSTVPGFPVEVLFISVVVGVAAGIVPLLKWKRFQ
ncbi:MAG: hypothetical protein Q6365_024350 [Candidatus Sigynarchaeota archaeon]